MAGSLAGNSQHMGRQEAGKRVTTGCVGRVRRLCGSCLQAVLSLWPALWRTVTEPPHGACWQGTQAKQLREAPFS